MFHEMQEREWRLHLRVYPIWKTYIRIMTRKVGLKVLDYSCRVNLDSEKCQKNKYRKFIRKTSIVVWVRTQFFSYS